MDQAPLLEYLIETGPTLIFRRTPDDVVTYVSPNIERLLGYPPREVIDVPGFWRDHVHPDDRDEYRAQAEQAFARGVTELARDYRFLHQDGTYRWLHARNHIEYDADSSAESLLGYALDMTDQRSIEQQSAQLFRFPLALIFVAGLDGYFKRVSTGYQRLLGWPEHELLARPFFEFVHPDDVAALAGSLQAVAEGRMEVINQEIRALCADGTYRWLMGSYRPLFDEGLMYGVAVDVTEGKRAEEALSAAKAEAEAAREEAEIASRAKNEFLSRMSHELRTPLNAILGFGQLLEMDDLGEQATGRVHVILRAGRHLLQLINEILDLARIEQGQLALSIEAVPVSQTVREAIELVRPLAASNGIQLRSEPPESDGHVLADGQRLKQVLLNLLSNAIKYNRESGEVAVSARASGERMRIAVADTGPGLAPEMIDRLFVPFERLGAEQTQVEGTGIGLSISKRLIELMGGAIWAESTIGAGSTFWIELDRAHPPEATAGLTPHTGEAVAHVGAERTVLYVEDNLSNLRLVEEILTTRPGVRLIAAMQGNLALELAREHLPDLILLDVHLPDIDGDEVLHRLRQHKETRDIPVIVVSAEATQRKVERFLGAGARAYLTKPFDVKQFLDVVGKTLES